jgi:pimeloyl-ACP methyl ester carboxylesterase
MPKALINGVQLHYAQSGRGHDMVMVHGLGANLAFWNLRIVPPLTREFRVTTYDLRGHGRSDVPLSGYTSLEMARDLVGLLEHLDVAPAHLVGHSFGGGVALLAAILRPERVRSLVLVDAVVPGLQRATRRGAIRRWRALRRELEELDIELSPGAEDGGADLLEELSSPEWRASRSRARNGDFFLPFGLLNGAPRAAQQWRNLLRTTSARRDFLRDGDFGEARLGSVLQDVLAVYGELSRYRPTCQALCGSLPRCRARLVPGAGHFHPLLQPGLLVQEIRSFLTELDHHSTSSGAQDGNSARP